MEIKPAPSTETPAEKMPFATYVKVYDSIEGMRTEWIAGKVAVYPTATLHHQEILQFFVIVLHYYLSINKMGEVMFGAFPMYLGDDRPAREPDLLIILNEHLTRIQFTHLDGIADIVVEIVSPESGARDHGTKLIEYEAAGIPEYWLIDPIRTDAVFYALGADKRYHQIPHDEQGRLVSHVLPGFVLSPSILWQDPLPDEQDMITLMQQMK